jgi:hypothetical protein
VLAFVLLLAALPMSAQRVTGLPRQSSARSGRKSW